MSELAPVIDQIKERLPIEQVVGQRVQLQRKGGRYWGLCPFHAEKSPSFTVHAEQNFFKCFGCGKGGDVITFVRELEGLEFMEALRALAEQAGVELPERSGATREPREAELRKQAREALALARRAMHECLYTDSGKGAREYLEGRGVDEQQWKRFKIGWVPNDAAWLSQKLIRGGLPGEALEMAGLAMRSKRDGSWVDRFRERLMFAVVEPGDRTVGFGGRYLPGSWSEQNQRGKYVNSPEGPLFPKRRLLYGMDMLQEGIRQAEDLPILLCEGYLDVIMLHQAGMPTALAALGTAFSEENARRLHRVGRPVALLLDADPAGRRAAHRAAQILVREGVEARMVELPDGKDPADLVSEGESTELRQRVAKAWDIIDWRLSVWDREGNLGDPQVKAKAAREMASWVQVTPDPVLAEVWLRRSCDRLGVSEQALRRHLRPSNSPAVESAPQPVPTTSLNPNPDPPRENLSRNEREIVATVLIDPSLAAPFTTQLQELGLTDDWARTALQWCFEQRNQGEDCSLADALVSFEGQPIQAWLDELRHLRLDEPKLVLERALEAWPSNLERAFPKQGASDEDLMRFRRTIRVSQTGGHS